MLDFVSKEVCEDKVKLVLVGVDYVEGLLIVFDKVIVGAFESDGS